MCVVCRRAELRFEFTLLLLQITGWAIGLVALCRGPDDAELENGATTYIRAYTLSMLVLYVCTFIATIVILCIDLPSRDAQRCALTPACRCAAFLPMFLVTIFQFAWSCVLALSTRDLFAFGWVLVSLVTIAFYGMYFSLDFQSSSTPIAPLPLFLPSEPTVHRSPSDTPHASTSSRSQLDLSVSV